MIALRPGEMHWLGGEGDDRYDQCAHGAVDFRIDSIRFAPVEGVADEFTVSAAALFLLRTLDHDHTARNPVAEGSQLFPHCGFAAFEQGGRFPVAVPGCDVGVDPEVVHSGGRVTVRDARGAAAGVTEAEWTEAVLGFVRDVQAFYDASPERIPPDESPDREGWAAFWREWRDRVPAAGAG